MTAPRFPRETIRRLLNPRSVAIVGASATPGSLGASVLANLDRLGYRGDIHLINPNRDSIGERACMKSADALPERVDVAVLAIPKPAVLDTLRALGRRKVGAAIIFSAGFAEAGAAGASEQQEIVRIATESGMLIQGPNCLGMINYVDGVGLSFIDIRTSCREGSLGVGVISQSGAMAAVLATMLAGRAANITYSISTGNEAASGVEDYLEYLIDDPQTRVFGLIVEQFRQPARFLALAEQARRAGKVLVLLHPGRSSAARASAATHTGALAGDFQVMRTVVEHQGVLFAESLEEFGDLLEITSRCRSLPCRGAAVLTESGAFKALALDLCEQVELPLPALDDASAPDLRAALPPFVPVSNPVDLTAQSLVDPDLYRKAIACLAADDRFGCILLTIIQADATQQKFNSILSAVKQHDLGKPVVFAGTDEGATVPPQYIDELRSLGVPYFPTAERAIRAVARITAWNRRSISPPRTVSPPRLKSSLPRGVVPEYRAKQVLEQLGISVPEGRFVVSLAEAQQAAAAIGFPVAVKAQAAELTHKSDAGGVILNLRDAEELAAAWDRLQANIARTYPDARLDGVLVEKMAGRGVELIIGGRHDPDWGPILLVGFGGVQAEILKDTRLLPPDLSTDQIVRQLDQLRCSRLLKGFRGEPPADIAAAADLIERVAWLLIAEPTIRELDLNPVMVHPRGLGATALDALMLVGD